MTTFKKFETPEDFDLSQRILAGALAHVQSHFKNLNQKISNLNLKEFTLMVQCHIQSTLNTYHDQGNYIADSLHVELDINPHNSTLNVAVLGWEVDPELPQNFPTLDYDLDPTQTQES